MKGSKVNKKVAGKTYFLEAIEYFQESYPDNQVYFIAVSDDLVWVRTENYTYLILVLYLISWLR